MTDDPLRSLFVDDPEMQELLQDFVAGLAGKCAALRAALDQGDAETLKRLGHQLKGSDGGYGFPQITDAGARLEDSVIEAGGVDPTVRLRAEELIQLCSRAQRSLE